MRPTTAGPRANWSSVRQRNNRPRLGFTLIELLVAIVLVAVGVVGVFGGIAALNKAEARAQDAELLQRLAEQKLHEFGTISDPQTADSSGDFTDEGHPDIEWSADVQQSGATDVDTITITATRGDSEQALTGLVYIRPTATTANGTPAASGGATGGAARTGQ